MILSWIQLWRVDSWREQNVLGALPSKRVPRMAVGGRLGCHCTSHHRGSSGGSLAQNICSPRRWRSERGSLLLVTSSVQVRGIYGESFITSPLFFYNTGDVAYLKSSGYRYEKPWISGHPASYISRNIIFLKKSP